MAPKPARVAARAVHEAVDRLQSDKTAGLSGWQASDVKPLLQHLRGLIALGAWTRMWACRTMHVACAQRWRALLANPFQKGDGGIDVRAVLISKVLLIVPSPVLNSSRLRMPA